MTIKEGRINTYYTNGWFYGENLLEELDTEGEYYICLLYTSPLHPNIGEISNDNIEKFELISDLPDGVISESVSDSSAQILIDSKTVGGHEIKYLSLIHI